MAQVSTYLNFNRTTEAAFAFYKTVFGTEYVGGIMRHGDVPPPDEMPAIGDEDKNLILNMQLEILGGHMIMGSDIPAAMGRSLTVGNNVQIVLDPDTREEAYRLFATLSNGGAVHDAMREEFWGDYYGSLADKFGVEWIINCTSKS